MNQTWAVTLLRASFLIKRFKYVFDCLILNLALFVPFLFKGKIEPECQFDGTWDASAYMCVRESVHKLQQQVSH